jgi:hypothetical protein
VFDGSLAGYGVLRAPVTVTLRAGRAVAATGEAGRWLLHTFDAGGNTGRLIAEFGIGTNPTRACQRTNHRGREGSGHRPPGFRDQRLLRRSKRRRHAHRRTAVPTHDRTRRPRHPPRRRSHLRKRLTICLLSDNAHHRHFHPHLVPARRLHIADQDWRPECGVLPGGDGSRCEPSCTESRVEAAAGHPRARTE